MLGVGKSGVPLHYHKPAAYNFITHPQNDELCYYQIAFKVKTGGEGGGGK